MAKDKKSVPDQDEFDPDLDYGDEITPTTRPNGASVSGGRKKAIVIFGLIAFIMIAYSIYFFVTLGDSQRERVAREQSQDAAKTSVTVRTDSRKTVKVDEVDPKSEDAIRQKQAQIQKAEKAIAQKQTYIPSLIPDEDLGCGKKCQDAYKTSIDLKNENAKLRETLQAIQERLNAMEMTAGYGRSSGSSANTPDLFEKKGVVYMSKGFQEQYEQSYEKQVLAYMQDVYDFVGKASISRAEMSVVNDGEVNNDGGAPSGAMVASVASASSVSPVSSVSGAATTGNGEGIEGQNSETSSVPGRDSITDIPEINAGKIGYATMLHTVNTDISVNEVLAELHYPSFNKTTERAILHGKFQVSNGYLILRFNSLTVGQSRYNIDAVAIDMETAEFTSVDEVDRHIPERVIAVLGAAWIQGIGQGYSNANQKKTTINTGTSTTVIEENDTSFWSIARGGLKNVGDMLVQIVQPYTQMQTTYKKYVNTGLGVMFLTGAKKASG